MTTAQRTATSTWTVDKAHSSVEFAVKHMMVSTVHGRFRDFQGTIYIDEEQPQNSQVEAWADVASIDTGIADRDAHLRSDDFFNAERFPRITFRSKRVEFDGSRKFRLVGDLTIRDVTREVVLDGEFDGRIVDPWGNERAGFSAEASISRKEFGVRWNQALEAGGVIVGDSVKIILQVEAVKQA
ncbi:MAG TPA: YceI family protein [bacterium]